MDGQAGNHQVSNDARAWLDLLKKTGALPEAVQAHEEYEAGSAGGEPEADAGRAATMGTSSPKGDVDDRQSTGLLDAEPSGDTPDGLLADAGSPPGNGGAGPGGRSQAASTFAAKAAKVKGALVKIPAQFSSLTGKLGKFAGKFMPVLQAIDLLDKAGPAVWDAFLKTSATLYDDGGKPIVQAIGEEGAKVVHELGKILLFKIDEAATDTRDNVTYPKSKFSAIPQKVADNPNLVRFGYGTQTVPFVRHVDYPGMIYGSSPYDLKLDFEFRWGFEGRFIRELCLIGSGSLPDPFALTVTFENVDVMPNQNSAIIVLNLNLLLKCPRMKDWNGHFTLEFTADGKCKIVKRPKSSD